MENLWAPWRIDYILGKKPEGCIFCDKPGQDKDAENFILYKGRHNFVMLNAYPYNNGHMMVVPYRHTASLTGWQGEEQQEMMQLAAMCVDLLKRVMRPDGFNLGMNMGQVGGGHCRSLASAHCAPLEWGYKLHARTLRHQGDIGGAGGNLQEAERGAG